MTVREWYRLQRRALWERQIGDAAALCTLAQKVIDGAPLDRVENCPPFKLLLANAAEWDRREQLLVRIHRQMVRALDEIDRELRRRAQLDYIAKDLLL